jgi:hypothetical protein
VVSHLRDFTWEKTAITRKKCEINRLSALCGDNYEFLGILNHVIFNTLCVGECIGMLAKIDDHRTKGPVIPRG